MTNRDAVIAETSCPRRGCRAPIGATCRTRSGRNHPERVTAAIASALYGLHVASCTRCQRRRLERFRVGLPGLSHACEAADALAEMVPTLGGEGPGAVS